MSGIWGQAQHYWQIFSHAWRRRREMESAPRFNHELEFLPAALEIQESPPSPLGRALAKALMLFFTLALVWSVVGEIDIVAVSPGKIIPAGKSKTIQPAETGVVRAIHVKDGQRVVVGDLLIELDPTIAEAERERTRGEWYTARARLARVRAIVEALRRDALVDAALPPLPDVPEQVVSSQRNLMHTQIAEYRAKQRALEALIEQKRAERISVEQELKKSEAIIPLISKRAEGMRQLVSSKLYPESEYLAIEQQRIEQVQNAEVLRSRMNETVAAIQQAITQREAIKAEFHKGVLAERAELELQIGSLDKEMTKAATRSELLRLTAPVTGTVQQLAVHTIGGVVTPAQPLMVIVPESQALEVEAWLENKDIGFVHEGQEAAIKVDAFPFTKYGTIPATVTHVAHDAMEIDKVGWVFGIHTSLTKSSIRVNGTEVGLSPGMAVMVEVKTGTRRIYEYFLSPIMKTLDESGRER